MYTALSIISPVEFILLVFLSAKVRVRRFDGSLLVDDTEEKTTLALEIETVPEQLVKQKSITLKVVNNLDE